MQLMETALSKVLDGKQLLSIAPDNLLICIKFILDFILMKFTCIRFYKFAVLQSPLALKSSIHAQTLSNIEQTSIVLFVICFSLFHYSSNIIIL